MDLQQACKLKERGRHDEAIKALTKIIDMDPEVNLQQT
jgi:hypothetical protein